MDDIKHLNDKIKEINGLHEEIKALNHFLDTVADPTKVAQSGNNFSSVLKIHTQKTFSIYGRRIFQSGWHEEQVEIPHAVFLDLWILIKEQLEKKKATLKELIRDEVIREEVSNG